VPLFRWRRRSGRHAASRSDVAPAARPGPLQPSLGAQPWSVPSSAGLARSARPADPAPVPTSGRAPVDRLPPPPTGPVHPYGEVRLGFADGSAVTLAADDPRVRAFRALARELARRG